MPELHPLQIEPAITRALEEDWGYGDWASDICVDSDKQARAKIIVKQSARIAGIEVAMAVFNLVDPQLKLNLVAKDGTDLEKGDLVLEISGRARSILRAERVALNFLGRMTGIATLTKEYAKLLEGSKAQLLDTRKTTPGMRIFEKTATVIGGARNHRFGLCDGVIVKENHIRAAGGIAKAVERLLDSLPPTLKIEVEVSNLTELQEALDAGADLIMLDNMSPKEMTLAVRTARGRAYLEASGNITLKTIEAVAATGVDFISTGSIIHSASWADFSLLFDPLN